MLSLFVLQFHDITEGITFTSVDDKNNKFVISHFLSYFLFLIQKFLGRFHYGHFSIFRKHLLKSYYVKGTLMQI